MKPGYFLPYARQSINADDIAEVTKVLQSELITRGPKVEEFEKTIAQYCGARFGVAFNSGTSSLVAACFAANLTRFDRLLTTPNTFIGSIIGAIQRGTPPVFIDIDSQTGNMDLDQLQYNLNIPSSRGRDIILPVHFAGLTVDMQKLEAMIKRPETVIIEDGAHALGSCYSDGQKVGCCAWSQMTVFSFHPNKHITTGEGGMVMTNDEELDHRLRLFRNNGIERNPHYLKQEMTPWHYEVQVISGNYNITDFQAALGLSQFKRLDRFIAKRLRLLNCYRDRLQNVSYLTMFPVEQVQKIAYHLCVVQIDFNALGTTRQAVMQKLLDAGIGTQVHYIPLYRHPAIAEICGDIEDYFPKMEAYYSQALSLPLHVEMEEEDVAYVCETLMKVLKK